MAKWQPQFYLIGGTKRLCHKLGLTKGPEGKRDERTVVRPLATPRLY